MQRPYEILCVLAVIASSILGAMSYKLPETDGSMHCDNDAGNIAARKHASNANIRPGENDRKFWNDVGNSILHQKLHAKRQYGVAKNVIFFLGDGMSITTLAASRIYMGQLENNTGENEMLSFEQFPYTGLSKTYCVDSQVADSACSATAYLTGVKGNIETIGVSGSVPLRDCMASLDPANQAVSSMAWAQRAGKRTGVVTNMRVTHATPAGAYASVAQREWECDADVANDRLLSDPEKCLANAPDIARQLIEKETGRRLNVIMGGGRRKFLPNTTVDSFNNTGQRQDGRNLIEEWLKINRTEGARVNYVDDRSKLESLNTTETDYLMGLFATGHMSYNLLANKTVEPTLVEMTEAAIRVLSKGDNGFYLFVEGGLIDWAHHDNFAHLALDETVMLSAAVRRARELTSAEDTLIVVTSDHSHTMTLNGYPHRGSDILGHPVVSKVDHMPYSTLSYANGPSAVQPNNTGQRYNLTDDDTADPVYRYPSLVKLTWETHGGDDVAVFASGPWAHLFVGNYEQNYIPYALSYAARMGPGAEHEMRRDGDDWDRSSGYANSASAAAAVGLFVCAIVLHLQVQR